MGSWHPPPPAARSHLRCVARLLLVIVGVAYATSPSTRHQHLDDSNDIIREHITATARLFEDGPGCDEKNSRYKALQCWLWNAKISLPSASFKEELITISIENMHCTNFQVTGLASRSTQASPLNPNPSITIDVAGISTKCKGKYNLGGFGSGDVVASVGNSDTPTLHLQVGLSGTPLGGSSNSTTDESLLPFPALASFERCTPSFLVKNVQFSGSISAHVIDLFSGKIGATITAALNQNICKAIKRSGESSLDEALHTARTYVTGLLGVDGVRTGSLPRFDTEPDVGSSRKLAKTAAVTWNHDMPFLKRLLLGINTFLSRHLNKGYILTILEKLSTWQSNFASDCKDCGFLFKGFNGLVNYVTDGKGSLEVAVPESFLNFHNNHTISMPEYGDVTFTVHKLRVTGINNLTDLALLQPSGESSLATSIASDAGFNISMLVGLHIKPTNSAVFKGNALNETFELHFNSSSFNLTSLADFRFDRAIFSKLSVGSFIYGSYTTFDNNRNVLNCIIEALSNVVLTDVDGHMDLDGMQISPYLPDDKVSGSLENSFDELINVVLQVLLTEYPDTITAIVAGVIRTPIKEALNDGLRNLVTDAKKKPLHCVNPNLPPYKAEHPLRLDTNRALVLFNDIVSDGSAVQAVNEFIDCVNEVLDNGNIFNGHFYDEFAFGDIGVVLHDMHFNNPGSVGSLKLLHPQLDHYHLANSIEYGQCSAHDCQETGMQFGMNVKHAKHGDIGNINVKISLKNLQVETGAELKFDMNWLPHLLVTDVLSHPQCLTLPVTTFDLYGFNATVEEVKIDITASFTHLTDGPRSFTYATNNPAELGSVFSSLMRRGSAQLEHSAKSATLLQLNEAPSVCSSLASPHRTDLGGESSGAAGLWALLFILVFIAGNAWLFLRGFDKEEEQMLSNEGLDDADAREGELDDERNVANLQKPLLDNREDEDPVETDGAVLEVDAPKSMLPLASSSSLMMHPTVPDHVKYGLPGILAVTIVLLLSSNFTTGASVDLLITKADGGSLTSLVNIWAFSLGSTIKEMVQAGVYLLMLLILFCSGIWPYIKLVLLFGCWFASTRRLTLVEREKALYLLDCLGKFSLIDAYVLVLMMVAFRYNLSVEGVGALDVYVTPKYGFYSFLFSTILSLVSGHVMLFLHRRTMFPRIPVYSGRKEALLKHVYDDKQGRVLLKMTRRFRRLIVFAILLTFVLISVGVHLKSFHFTFKGVAGAALGAESSKSYSLVSIGLHIPQSVTDPSSFGIHWIQLTYFFFALVMPLICLLGMLILFLVPLRLKRAKQLFMLVEVANSWSAIEVFAIAVIASLVEISPFAKGMVSEHCSLLNQILSGWDDGAGSGDLHYCFDVRSRIDGTAAVLFIGVLLNSLIISTLHRLAHHAVWERVEREDRPDASEDETRVVKESVRAHGFVSWLHSKPRLGGWMFEEISFGPHSDYDDDFENVVDHEDDQNPTTFWNEWSKIVSVI